MTESAAVFFPAAALTHSCEVQTRTSVAANTEVSVSGELDSGPLATSNWPAVTADKEAKPTKSVPDPVCTSMRCISEPALLNTPVRPSRVSDAPVVLIAPTTPMTCDDTRLRLDVLKVGALPVTRSDPTPTMTSCPGKGDTGHRRVGCGGHVKRRTARDGDCGHFTWGDS
jgi:hypothetical protein